MLSQPGYARASSQSTPEPMICDGPIPISLPNISSVDTLSQDRSASSRPVRCCAVCGDTPAKLHYGTLACFGCKGFFRRAVKEGRNKYVCRYDKKCVVDKYERNSCRYCRFRRCLQVGMNPDAVRPDRDAIGKPPRTARPLKPTKSTELPIKSEEQRLRDSPPLNPEEDWTKTLNWSNKQLLNDLLELDSEVRRASGTISPDTVVKFSLKSFINERTLFLHEKLTNNSEDPITSLWRIVEVVDWVNGLCRMALRYCENGSITVEDKVAIVQNAFCRLVLLSMASRGAVSHEHPGYPFNHLNEKSYFELWLIEDFIPSLKRLNPTQTEIFAFKAIITMDPTAKGIRPAASETISEFRNRLQELFAKLLKKSKISAVSPYAQFGNYLLLIPNLISVSDRLNDSLRTKYPLNGTTASNEPHIDILKDMFNPDTSDYLRFPHYSSRRLSSTSSSSMDRKSSFETLLPKQTRPRTPPQIMINDQLSGFEHYNWHLSTFASAFSNLQTSSGLQAPIITSEPKSPITLLNGFPPMFNTSESTASHVSPALPTQSMTPAENFMTTTGANSLYINRFSVPSPMPSFYSTALSSVVRDPINSMPPPSSSGLMSNTRSAMDTFPPSSSSLRPNTLEIPTQGGRTQSTQAGVIPKLPLQLTKSIEEMLRPAVPDDGSTWNKPLAKDWADKVSTPAFNREVVAKFFPECANANI